MVDYLALERSDKALLTLLNIFLARSVPRRYVSNFEGLGLLRVKPDIHLADKGIYQ